MSKINKPAEGNLADYTIENAGGQRYNPTPSKEEKQWQEFLEAVSLILANYRRVEEKKNG